MMKDVMLCYVIQLIIINNTKVLPIGKFVLSFNISQSRFYSTTPQKHVNNRVMYCPRGRVWGGSSSLNAMVYIRGHAFDYDRWEKEGASGWDYDHCLPYFKKAQNHSLGADTYRGGDGPLHTSQGL